MEIQTVEYNNYNGTRCSVLLDTNDSECYHGNIEKIFDKKKDEYRKNALQKANFCILDHESYVALKFVLHTRQSRENEKLELFQGVRILVDYTAKENTMIFGTKPKD